MNLYIYQGETWTKGVTWTDNTGVPIDLTGFTAEMAIKQDEHSPPSVYLTNEDGITLGDGSDNIVLHIPSDKTLNIPSGRNKYDLYLEREGQDKIFIYGDVKVGHSITRSNHNTGRPGPGYDYNWGPPGPDGEQGPAGEGVAPGGTTGQHLAKASDDDYDTEWVDADSGGTDLSNYYTKDEVYNKGEVDALIPDPVDDSNYFKLDADNTATGENIFTGAVTLQRPSSGAHIIQGDTQIGSGSDQADYRGAIINSTNLVNKGYVDDAVANSGGGQPEKSIVLDGSYSTTYYRRGSSSSESVPPAFDGILGGSSWIDRGYSVSVFFYPGFRDADGDLFDLSQFESDARVMVDGVPMAPVNEPMTVKITGEFGVLEFPLLHVWQESNYVHGGQNTLSSIINFNHSDELGVLSALGTEYTIQISRDGVLAIDGGTTGQHLAKKSDADFDYEWVDAGTGTPHVADAAGRDALFPSPNEGDEVWLDDLGQKQRYIGMGWNEWLPVDGNMPFIKANLPAWTRTVNTSTNASWLSRWGSTMFNTPDTSLVNGCLKGPSGIYSMETRFNVNTLNAHVARPQFAASNGSGGGNSLGFYGDARGSDVAFSFWWGAYLTRTLDFQSDGNINNGVTSLLTQLKLDTAAAFNAPQVAGDITLTYLGPPRLPKGTQRQIDEADFEQARLEMSQYE